MSKALTAFKDAYMRANRYTTTGGRPLGCLCNPDYYDAKTDGIIECAENILSAREYKLFSEFKKEVATGGVIY